MQLLFLPMLVLLAAEDWNVYEHGPKALVFRVLLMIPLSLSAASFLALYLFCVVRERRRGPLALVYAGKETRDSSGVSALLLMPLAFFAGWSPVLWDARGHLGLVAAVIVEVALALITLLAFVFLLVLFFSDGFSGGEEPEEEPEPEPPWWPGFEAEFRRYVGSGTREPVGSR